VAVDRLKRDFLSFAQKYKDKYKLEGGNPDDLDEFKRYMDIYFHLDDVQDYTYTFTQSSPSDVWTITHNLDRYPSVSVVDSADNMVVGDVEYVDSNTIEITFCASFSGKAYLN
jgi:hypothetical protein